MKIKECPFCGSDAKIARTKLTNKKVIVFIKCTRCSSHTPHVEVVTSEEQATKECIENWNRRAVPET